MPRVSSFDIFDTLLTRATGSPGAVFRLLGRKARAVGLIGCGPEAFALARIDAERRANRNSGLPEAPMGLVYRELGAALGLTDERRDRLCELELETEAHLLRPVAAGLARLAQSRARGDTIAFLSDMYLPEEFLRGQLQRIGAWRDGDLLLVSSVCGVTKGGGGLFREAAKRLGVAPAQLTHLGNSAHADVKGASLAGATGEFFDDANPNRFERLLDSHCTATEGFASVLAGASKLARLDHAGAHEALARVTAGVIAPVLSAFCLWVLTRAHQLGLKRLYFVSRDGEVLLRVAAALNRRLALPIELRYLYGSRQSWHLPSVRELTDREYLWLLERTEVSSVRRVCSRVELEPEAIESTLVARGFPRPAWDQALDKPGLERLRGVFETPEAREAVLDRAARAREIMVEYLHQERLLEDDRWAMVDVGWRARLQSSLALVLAGAGGPTPKGLYFGLNDRPEASACGLAEAYLFDRKSRLGVSSVPTDLSTHMEMFCCASHGTVRRYQRVGERPDGNGAGVGPVLKHAVNESAMRWGLERVRATIDRFLDHLELDPALVDVHADLRPAVVQLLRELSYRPTADEARTYGAFDFASDQSEDHFQRFARAYGPVEGFRSLLPPRLQSRKADVRWQAGSIELSAPWCRGVLRGLFRARMKVRDRYRLF